MRLQKEHVKQFINMKKLLAIIVLGLLFGGNAYAEILNCKVKKAYICKSDGCKNIKSEISLTLDTNKLVYQRGDSKGVDTYKASISNSGIYLIGEIKGSALLKIETTTLNFTEIVHLGLTTYNNFGTCKIL